MSILMHATVAFCYIGLGWWAWRGASSEWSGLARIANGEIPPNSSGHSPLDAPQFGWIERLILLMTWIAHGFLLAGTMFRLDGLQFGFALALSVTMWLAVAVYWVESLYFGLASMRLLVFPIASVCALLPAWFPGALTPVALEQPALAFHLLVSLAAYGLLTIAAIHAFLMAALDRWLHGSGTTPDVNRARPPTSLMHRVERAILRQLPPLMTMERLLFRLLFAGFALLTLTVVSGLVFSEEVFGRALRFEHKTVFTLLSWLFFGGLIFGRLVYGWRGRRALRWTLAGFITLLSGYVGSRFVLEVILHRL